MPKRPLDPDKAIRSRFLAAVYQNIGPGRKYRFKKDYTDAAGMKQQELSKIEAGASIQLRHLLQLKRLTGVDLNWILCGKQAIREPVTAKHSAQR